MTQPLPPDHTKRDLGFMGLTVACGVFLWFINTSPVAAKVLGTNDNFGKIELRVINSIFAFAGTVFFFYTLWTLFRSFSEFKKIFTVFKGYRLKKFSIMGNSFEMEKEGKDDTPVINIDNANSGGVSAAEGTDG